MTNKLFKVTTGIVLFVTVFIKLAKGESQEQIKRELDQLVKNLKKVSP